jgi:hypothetical protein
MAENDVARCHHTIGTDMIPDPDTAMTMVSHYVLQDGRILIPSQDTHSRGYEYMSPRRGQYAGGYSGSRRPPPDPHTFDYPSSLKQYAEWFRYYYPQQAIEEDNADKAAEQEAGDGSKPRNGIKAKWENYKKDFAATQVSVILSQT